METAVALEKAHLPQSLLTAVASLPVSMPARRRLSRKPPRVARLDQKRGEMVLLALLHLHAQAALLRHLELQLESLPRWPLLHLRLCPPAALAVGAEFRRSAVPRLGSNLVNAFRFQQLQRMADLRSHSRLARWQTGWAVCSGRMVMKRLRLLA